MESQQHWPAELAAETLVSEGVTAMFGILGGHINPLQDYAYRAGIDVYQMRHEQAAVFAADAYGRHRREPGVCFGTAGPGMTNMVTGLHLAYVARSPLVCLLGGHKLAEEGRSTIQEANAASILNSVTKWTARCTRPEQAGFYIRKAFRDAMTYPYGPVAVEFPLDTFNYQPILRGSQVSYLPGAWNSGIQPDSPGDPAAIKVAADLLLNAKRPLIIGGDGVHWDNAGQEVRLLAENLGIPVNLRRLARGAIHDDHPLLLRTELRKSAIEKADVILLAGLRTDYLEGFGDWNAEAIFIQVNNHRSEIATHLRTGQEIIGNVRSIADSIRHEIDSRQGAVESRIDAGWVPGLQEGTAAWLSERDQRVSELSAITGPLHPDVVAAELAAALPSGIPIIQDSFTASASLNQFLEPSESGGVLDAGLSATFGHGVGMAIGASLARGGTPVVAVLGDGGVGAAGGDIETAVRLNLPVIYVIYNNSALCGGLEAYGYGENYSVLGPKARGGFNVSIDVAYEDMYAPLGCHTERVNDPGQLGDAVKRCLDSGKTCVINVIGDRDVPPPLYDTSHARDMFWHLPQEEVQAPLRERHQKQLYPRYHGGRILQEDLSGS